MKDSTGGLKEAFFWICEKIVAGTVKAVKLIPPADRLLTAATTWLMQVMMRHKIISLTALAALPALSLLVLETDGVLDPVSDALDLALDILSALPFEIMVPLVLLGSAVGMGLLMYRRKVGPGQAAKIVFYAVFARIFYLAVLLAAIIFLLQFTPLKTDRRNDETVVFVRLWPGGPACPAGDDDRQGEQAGAQGRNVTAFKRPGGS